MKKSCLRGDEIDNAILVYLDQSPDMVAWVPQYHDTAAITTGTGETFNQNLIAMRAGMWRQMTGYDGNLDNLVKHFRWID